MEPTAQQRLPRDLLARADQLRLAGQTRIGVLTVAIRLGLTALEREAERRAQAERDAELEPVARAIYEGWRDQRGWEPWQEGGNSLKQDEARRMARAGRGRAA